MITHDPEEVNQFGGSVILFGSRPEPLGVDRPDEKGRGDHVFDLFQYDFYVASLVGYGFHESFSPVLGIFLIWDGRSLMSDTLSHVSLAVSSWGFSLGISLRRWTMIIVIIAAVFFLSICDYLRTFYGDRDGNLIQVLALAFGTDAWW